MGTVLISKDISRCQLDPPGRRGLVWPRPWPRLRRIAPRGVAPLRAFSSLGGRRACTTSLKHSRGSGKPECRTRPSAPATQPVSADRVLRLGPDAGTPRRTDRSGRKRRDSEQGRAGSRMLAVCHNESAGSTSNDSEALINGQWNSTEGLNKPLHVTSAQGPRYFTRFVLYKIVAVGQRAG